LQPANLLLRNLPEESVVLIHHCRKLALLVYLQKEKIWEN
jgi:hypothetical protein